MIPTTRIVGDLRGIGVSPASGVKVIVRLSQKAALYYGNVQVFDSQKEVFTDQNGLWSIDLVDTDFMEGDLFYYFWIAGREFRKFVPASSLDVNFNELEGYV